MRFVYLLFVLLTLTCVFAEEKIDLPFTVSTTISLVPLEAEVVLDVKLKKN
jgi:hypothetical protein